jgi:hypothetical protein
LPSANPWATRVQASKTSPKILEERSGQLTNVPDDEAENELVYEVSAAEGPIPGDPLPSSISRSELSADIGAQGRQEAEARESLGDNAGNGPNFLPPRSGKQLGRLANVPDDLDGEHDQDTKAFIVKQPLGTFFECQRQNLPHLLIKRRGSIEVTLDMHSSDFNLSARAQREVRSLLAEIGAQPPQFFGSMRLDPVGAEVVLAEGIPLSLEPHLVARLCAIISEPGNLAQALPWSRNAKTAVGGDEEITS